MSLLGKIPLKKVKAEDLKSDKSAKKADSVKTSDPKKLKPKKGFGKSLSQTKNWYQDRYETVIIQRNVLFLFLIGLIVTLSVMMQGFINLNAKKVYEPFIVQVEDNTGIITKVDNEVVRKLSADKALRNSTIVRYILARENYNSAEFNYNYKTVVRLFSSPEVYAAFSKSINPKNPNSPLGYGSNYKIETKIKSITDVDEKQQLIQVRVTKAKVPMTGVRATTAQPDWEKSYVISLKYQYVAANMSEADRYINPLGLQITDYNISEEINATKF